MCFVLFSVTSLIMLTFTARAALLQDMKRWFCERPKTPMIPHLHVIDEEWLTFAHGSLDNGFYTVASKVIHSPIEL